MDHLDGQGALLLLSPEKKGLANRLRYYELDAGKGRLLGHVRSGATLAERKPANDQWAFALSERTGFETAGDLCRRHAAIHARIDDASQRNSPPAAVLPDAGRRAHCHHGRPGGAELPNSIYEPSKNATNTAYLQFLSSGDSLTISTTGEDERGGGSRPVLIFRSRLRKVRSPFGRKRSSRLSRVYRRLTGLRFACSSPCPPERRKWAWK